MRTVAIFSPWRHFRKRVCDSRATVLAADSTVVYAGPVQREPAVAVRRAMAILEALGGDEALEAGGLGVTRLSELTGNEISRVSRTLDVLAETRLVERDPESLVYRLGWRFFAIAARAGDLRLRTTSPQFVWRLTDEFGESAFLSVLDGREVLTIVSESPAHTIQAAGWTGRSHPYVYCTSAGRALLFGHSDEELDGLLRDVEFRPRGPNGPTSFDELTARLARERQQGWVYTDEEFEPGLVAIAAPVFGFDGRVVAALNLSGPKFRADSTLAAAGPRLVEVAAELTSRLGKGAATDEARATG
jgi:DNA-binding IclR family transcriptional regulator